MKRSIYLSLLLIARWFALHSPFGLGKYRLAGLVHSLANALPSDERFTVRSKDGRRFRLEAGEPQYRMGVLGLGDFEAAESAAVARCLKSGDCAVDAGANFGWYTTLMSRLVGEQGAVHAFEPVPRTYEVLQGNCSLNACRNVRLNNLALGTEEGEVDLLIEEGAPSGDASVRLGQKEPSKGKIYTCKMTTLDAYFSDNDLKACDFIKADVEGAETLLINGSRRVLSRFQPTILIEINPSALAALGTTSGQLLEAIAACGSYRFFRVEGDHGALEEIAISETETLESYINVLAVSRTRGELLDAVMAKDVV